MKRHETLSEWSSHKLYQLCKAYDAFVKPRLAALGIISSAASTVGLFSQFDDPTFSQLLLCCGVGVALLMIASSFWQGAWHVPHLETKRPLLVYALVATLGFGSYVVVSGTANLSATAGQSSLELNQNDTTDALENSGQSAKSYVDQMRVAQSGLEEQAVLARQLEQAEITGQGPTGVPGRGSVSNSFAASAGKYDQAATSLERALVAADARLTAFETIVAELRAVQAEPNESRADKTARLKVLSGQAIREMRALLSLDPARSIRAAAASIAAGVPAQSRANAQSQARIAEINANMRTYAGQMEAEADRIAALAPSIPEQSTLSTAERLLQTMWRLPAWTAVALLLDAMGWVCVGFRVALYQALKAKLAEEAANPDDFVVTPDDFERLERAVKRAEESRNYIEAVKEAPKRGRPRVSQQKALPKAKPAKAANTNRKPKSGGGAANG